MLLLLAAHTSFWMGTSNLKIALERAYKDWRGDKKELDRHIEETTAAYAALTKRKPVPSGSPS